MVDYSALKKHQVEMPNDDLKDFGESRLRQKPGGAFFELARYRIRRDCTSHGLPCCSW